jgi:lipoprotein-anchoring transpeptidase ErfK/SrfK
MGNYYGCDLKRQVITFELPSRVTRSDRYVKALMEIMGVDAKSTAAKAPPRIGAKRITQIVVSKRTNTLVAMNGSDVVGTYPVSTGRRPSWTPVGTFRVVSKSFRPGGNFGTRWIGLSVSGKYCGLQIGIHGTDEPGKVGKPASRGCIRMRNSDIEELYPLVSSGVSVKITNDAVKTASSLSSSQSQNVAER